MAAVPTLFLGSDSETTMLYLYPFTFGYRSPDPFYYFFHILPTQAGELAYRPINIMLFTVDYLVFGTNVFWYRLENLVIFLMVVFGMMFLAKKLLMNEWGILATGLFLVLHPVHELMLIAIFSRTDFGAALIVVVIANLLLTRYPHYKLDAPLIGAYIVFLIGIFWKESTFSLVILILFMDLTLGWSKGRWHSRALLHLPFYLMAISSIFLQIQMTHSLGNKLSLEDFWNSLKDPANTIRFFEPVWAIWSEQIQKAFLIKMDVLAGAIGFGLTLLLLLTGPGIKTRLSLLAMLILLGPYILSYLSFMHGFVPSLGLALWAGFFTQSFMSKQPRIIRFIPLLIFIPLLFMWIAIYTYYIPPALKAQTSTEQAIKYLMRKYPHPPANSIFLIRNWHIPNESKKHLMKRISVIEENLRLAYDREDVSIYPLDTVKSQIDGSNQYYITTELPPYAQLGNEVESLH